MKKSKPARIGTRLTPNLTVLGVIDGGSIDPVYIVWNHRAWCPMACKVFSSSQRARREADVLRALSHPNVVRLLELEAPVFMLMPFLEGPTLSNMIRNAPTKRLPADDALRIAIHLGAALLHVHECGHLHMDVKPSNIIIARGGIPILFDFGTARSQSDVRPAEIIGTDQYLAPEEAQLGEVGPAADVFSFGATLFEMLSGEVPFLKHSKLKPFPQIDTDARDLKRLRPSLPRALCDVVGRCLSRDPASRPALADVLPHLNQLICRGPKMWPQGFDPRRQPTPPARPSDLQAHAVRFLV